MVHDSGKRAMPRRRKILFRVVALVLIVGILELLSAAAAAVIPYPPIRRASALYAEQAAQIRQILDRSVPHHVEIDPVLGWRHTPNFQGPMNRMNAAGLRGTREYAPTPPVGVLRIAAFGDSFVYGAEVDNAAGWAGRIESENRDFEVLNYGVAGYGVDQAYLRYLREGKAFSPRVVLMGFIPDDINRATSVYRRFLSPGAALFKPRYVLNDHGELVLLEVPLKTPADYEHLLLDPHEITRIGRNDYWYPSCVYDNPLHDYSATLRLACAAGGQVYRRWVDPDRPVKGRFFNEDSSAFKIHTALFRAFSAAVRQNGARPVVVMLPDLKAVARMGRGEPPIYQPLMDYLRNNDLPYLDAADAFRPGDRVIDTRTLFAPGGHYSASGNELVAAWLASKLRTVSDQPTHSAPASSQNSAAHPPRQ
jgi:hypothetical protein